MVSNTASTGLTKSGVKKPTLNWARFNCDPAASSPVPTRAPVNAWVVEMGNPSNVARKTVAPAPAATASKKSGEAATAAGTSPAPENACTSASAKYIEQSEPANVVIVASAIALL